MKDNIFENIPRDVPEELIETLASRDRVRIERIVSRGQASPAGFWYDQEQSEFVLLLKGGAGLSVEGVEPEIILHPGDFVDIPAHRKHRVNWTDPEKETVWLAVFY